MGFGWTAGHASAKTRLTHPRPKLPISPYFPFFPSPSILQTFINNKKAFSFLPPPKHSHKTFKKHTRTPTSSAPELNPSPVGGITEWAASVLRGVGFVVGWDDREGKTEKDEGVEGIEGLWQLHNTTSTIYLPNSHPVPPHFPVRSSPSPPPPNTHTHTTTTTTTTIHLSNPPNPPPPPPPPPPQFPPFPSFLPKHSLARSLTPEEDEPLAQVKLLELDDGALEAPPGEIL
jgi:hypothetical protein